MELARRLGFADKYNPKMLDVTDWREWDEQVIERIYKPAYEEWAKDETGILAYNGIEPRPWEEFAKLSTRSGRARRMVLSLQEHR